MSQKHIFLGGEGNAYHRRNAGIATDLHGKIAPALQALNIRPRKLLEIGCSDGTGLENLRRIFGAECHGITPGPEPIAAGRRAYPELQLTDGTADTLPFEAGMFDTVVFGFCLYLCDPELYPRIVAESDRVLADRGTLVVADFLSDVPHSNDYRHAAGARSYKREFSRLWLERPAYRLLSRTLGDEGTAVDVLAKAHGTSTEVI